MKSFDRIFDEEGKEDMQFFLQGSWPFKEQKTLVGLAFSAEFIPSQGNSAKTLVPLAFCTFFLLACLVRVSPCLFLLPRHAGCTKTLLWVVFLTAKNATHSSIFGLPTHASLTSVSHAQFLCPA